MSTFESFYLMVIMPLGIGYIVVFLFFTFIELDKKLTRIKEMLEEKE